MKVFNEDTRVKIPATIQLMRIGYDYQSLNDEGLDIDFKTKIFKNRFKESISRINGKQYTDAEISGILTDIDNTIKNNDLGKAFQDWLIYPRERVKLIDFEDVDNNDFAVVDELPYSIKEDTEAGSFRPDVNILINGMPLAFLEVKKPNNDGGIQMEFDRMVKQRLKKPEFKKHFNMLQVISFSNNMEYEDPDDAEDVKAGSFYSTPNDQKTTFSFFREDSEKYHDLYSMKDIDMDTIEYVTEDLGYSKDNCHTPEFKTNLDKNTPCNRFVTSIFDKERLLYVIHYGIVFIDADVPERHIMRYPQFFACQKTVARIDEGGKAGIIWHTQGSGKTALASFANRIIRDYFAKKQIFARFFFVVDRLDLLRQASDEFKMRGLHVITCNSKAEFTKELKRPLASHTDLTSIGEVCVVNIQKFESNMPKAKNDYGVNCQRVFFIDEAHRSYSMTGEYFKNLMTCDKDAIYIALTGTPLLSAKERSNLKFGEYIHKYFYDKSIADGYTLRIKKEAIDTVAKADIKNNLDLENADLNSKDVFESDAYISNLGAWIEKDFKNFRLQNTDPSIGGMVVCRTNEQAKKMHQWFVDNSDLNTGLVISDEADPIQAKENKNNQIDFRESTKPDMLVVNYMLTTGYDVKRLKKMYLLRGPHAQNLLQTISRVNRPYTSPYGKVYKYGYIVDFVDIEEEYDRTLAAYLKELEDDFDGETGEGGSLGGLVIDKETIHKKYEKLQNELDEMGINTSNLEAFSKMLVFLNIEALRKLKRIFDGMKECYTEFVLSNADEYLEEIDEDHLKKLQRTTRERINFFNLSAHTVDTMNVISNDEIVEILYEFIKVKITVLDLSRFDPSNAKVKNLIKAITDVQGEVKKNQNKDDIEIIKLDELLQKAFEKLKISNLDDLDEITDELLDALEKARKINEENDRLAADYDGNFAFVKSYQNLIANYTVDRSVAEKALKIIYEELKDILDTDSILIQGRKNFIDSTKAKVTKALLKEGVYSKIKPFYDEMLGDLYLNIQSYK